MRRPSSGVKARRMANERALARRASRRPAFSAFAALTTLVLIVISVRFLGAAHPEPRTMDHTGHVLPQQQFREHPGVQQGYAEAAEIAHVLDGLYCYCRCSQHSAHYSLLNCFISAHAARCDICLMEAAIAYQMSGADAASMTSGIGSTQRTEMLDRIDWTVREHRGHALVGG